MNRVYCTYFDSRYAPRGIAMIRSLRRYEPEAAVWVLCLDEVTRLLFETSKEPGVVAVDLGTLESLDRELASARSDGRSIVEYFYTSTPCFVRYVLQRSGAGSVTYLDADLWFFAGPQPLYDEMGNASVLIISHRYPPRRLAKYKRYGIYKVGWLTFKNDPRGMACLNWWRARCVEWCSSIVDDVNGRYCDQRYLDRFPELFEGVHILQNPGANLGPWNLDGHRITETSGHIEVDGNPLIFFHFHSLSRISRRRFRTPLDQYGVAMTGLARDKLFVPYLTILVAAEAEVEKKLGGLTGAVLDRPAKPSPIARLRKHAGVVRAAIMGAVVALPE